jgi:MoaA/NifB/PqqE/SkfB family radical SAM enzyme
MAVFDIINECNFKCIYCNRRTKNTDLLYSTPAKPTVSDILYVYNQICSMGIKHLALQGGEPFLRKDLCDIIREIGKQKAASNLELKKEWKAVIDANLSFSRLAVHSCLVLKKISFPILSITTNGSIYSDEIKSAMLNNNFHLEVSLDSHDPIINGGLRVSDSVTYLNIIENIKNFSKELPVIINCTVSSRNVDYMMDMINFAGKLDCIHIVFNPMMTTGLARADEAEWVKSYVRQVKKIIEFSKKNIIPVIVEIVLPIWFLESDELYNQLKKELVYTNNIILHFYECTANVKPDDICITSALDVFGCPNLIHFPSCSLGNLRINNLADIWNSKENIMCSSDFSKENKLRCPAELLTAREFSTVD